MSIKIWERAREKLLNERISEFVKKNAKQPTIAEEEQLEMDISEDELRDMANSMKQDTDEVSFE